MREIKIKCESCNKSMWCRDLKPCKNYAFEQSSNFLAEVKMVEKKFETEFLIR